MAISDVGYHPAPCLLADKHMHVLVNESYVNKSFYLDLMENDSYIGA